MGYMYLERDGYAPLLHILVSHAPDIRWFVKAEGLDIGNFDSTLGESAKKQIYFIGLYKISIPLVS